MNRIKELRIEKNLTLKKLSEELQLSPQVLSRYELGQREADYNTLVRLANYFNVSIDYILGYENKKEVDITSEKMSSSKSVISIGRKGKKSIYELSDEDAEFVDEFIAKYIKNKKNKE